MEKKYCLTLDSFKQRLLVSCLNEWRNKLLRDAICTEDVDTLLLKIIDAKAGRCGLFRKGV